jgi:hypothetical protein
MDTALVTLEAGGTPLAAPRSDMCWLTLAAERAGRSPLIMLTSATERGKG